MIQIWNSIVTVRARERDRVAILSFSSNRNRWAMLLSVWNLSGSCCGIHSFSYSSRHRQMCENAMRGMVRIRPGALFDINAVYAHNLYDRRFNLSLSHSLSIPLHRSLWKHALHEWSSSVGPPQDERRISILQCTTMPDAKCVCVCVCSAGVAKKICSIFCSRSTRIDSTKSISLRHNPIPLSI